MYSKLQNDSILSRKNLWYVLLPATEFSESTFIVSTNLPRANWQNLVISLWATVWESMVQSK